jgi:hypothetical protein
MTGEANTGEAMTGEGVTGEGATMDKPFHLMTPAERTAWRIARNRAIDAKIADKPQPVSVRSNARSGGGGARSSVAAARSGARGTAGVGGTRATPAERAALGTVIRKVPS